MLTTSSEDSNVYVYKMNVKCRQKNLVQKLEGKNHGQKIEILIFMSSCYNGKQKQKKKNERMTTKVKKVK